VKENDMNGKACFQLQKDELQ